MEYRRALGMIAARADIDVVALADRIEALSLCLAPLGLSEPRPAGRLRRVVGRLLELENALGEWAKITSDERCDVAALCSAAAAHTAGLCRGILEIVDRRLSALIPMLRAWPREREPFDDAQRRLAWLLDGWSRAIVAWEAARDAPPAGQQMALGAIFRSLPLLPSGEDQSAAGLDLVHAHQRMVRRHSRLFDDAEAAPAAADLMRQAELANLDADLL
jgi:hypothetical protein